MISPRGVLQACWLIAYRAMNQDCTPCVKPLDRICIKQCLQWIKLRSVHRIWMRDSFEK